VLVSVGIIVQNKKVGFRSEFFILHLMPFDSMANMLWYWKLGVFKFLTRFKTLFDFIHILAEF